MKTQFALTGIFFLLMSFISFYLFFGLIAGIVATVMTGLFLPMLLSVSKDFSQAELPVLVEESSPTRA